MIRKITLLAVLFFSLAGIAKAQYCNSNFTSVGFEWITNVNFAGINNTSGGNTGGPVNYLSQTATVTAGQNYNLSVTIDPDANDYIYAWIDWNQDLDFADPGETYTVAANIGVAGPHVLNIPVPGGATPGTTRMRVMCDWNNAVPNPCRNATWGEAEDYSVLVLVPPPIDAAAISLVYPTTTGCKTASEQVTLRIQNTGSGALDFTANNMTTTVNVTGALTQTLNVTLTDNSLNGGLPLAAMATLDIPLGTINMTAAGTYTFNGNTAVTGDGYAPNDALASAVNVVISGGTASASVLNLCAGDSVDLTVTGFTNGGTIQWQDSLVGGAWANIPGATTATYTAGPTDTTYYRAVICSSHNSNATVVNYVLLGNPTTIDTSRCGIGPVDLIASGNATINWYDAITGGVFLGTGDTLTVNVFSDTTFYASNGTGNPPSAHTTTFAGGNNNLGNMFSITAITTVTITGFDVNFAGTGDWTIYYRPDDYLLTPGSNTTLTGWSLVGSATGVVGAGTGLATPLPIPFSITIPAGSTYSFHTISTAGTVTYTNGTTLGNVFNSNADFQFREGWGCGGAGNCINSPRVFNGNINYYSGCSSARIPLNVDFTPAPPINFSASATSICDVDTITLSVTSADLSYTYTYSPTTDLAASTGNPVDAWPQDDITYVVSGLDTAGCAITDTLSITVAHAPQGTFTMSDDFVCVGDSVTLNMSATAGGMFFSSGPITNIPDGDPIGARDTIIVSGAQGSLASGDIDSVCIDITHTWDSDLTITLISPAGTLFDLSQNEGGSADNYTNTCFNMNAITPIALGTAPFTGSYIPDGAGGFDSFNGENANGGWQLWVVDGAGADVGTINNWNITFAQFNPPVLWSSVPAGLNDTNFTVVVNPTTTTTYIAALTDTNNGCTRNYVDTVTVNPLPVVTLGPDTAICSNYAGITLNGTNPGAGTYLWQDGQTGAMYFASLPGNYSVQVTDTNGCVGSDNITVGVITASIVSIDANLTTIHSADLDAGPNFASYVWSTSATTQVINVTTNGTYYVTCVDQNGCVSTDTMSIIFTLGNFNPNGSETTLQLYPNPSQGIFNLNIDNLETSDLVIDIMDMKGSIIYNRVIGSVSGSTVQSFNLGDLRMGTYNLRVIANGKTSTLRFVVTQ